ncbi:MAG: BamA/TamA family outer membrane protein, partial [Deltaproteobacteria bacterium]|nr:BamA/TamA family outer membrane protein [Deltaproteobacteria bacterium]
PVAQTYRQSIFGSVNFMQISPSASGDSIIYQNTKRLTEFTVGYGYNSVDYNINPQYGSSFNFTYNIANSNIFSPFSFSQFMLQYVRNFKINADNIISVRGIGVFADGNVPEALDYYLGGINGIMGIPASEPFIGNDAVIAEADYERNIYRGLNLNLLDNLIDITAVTGNVIGGAGKLDDTVPSVIHKGVIYSFAGLGLHFKTYFFGIYPEMLSFYAAKAFGGRVGSEYGVRYYFGLNQPF